MEKKADLKKNYLYRSLYDIFAIISPIITAPYVSRVLGAEGVGIYSYTGSILMYFTMIAALGTTSYGIRECSRNRDSLYELSKTFWEIELLAIITTFFSCIMWGTLCIIERQSYGIYFLALFPTLVSTSFDISWLFTGIERIKEIVLRNTMIRIAGILFLFVLVRTKDDLVLYILINSFSQLLGNMSMWVYLPHIITKVHFHELRVFKHFKQTLIYFIPTIATSVYTVLDKTLIGVITHDNYSNGYYEQSTKIINIAKTLTFSSINSVMEARMAFLFKNYSNNEIQDKISRTFDFIMFMGWGCTFGINAIASRFVPVFFGDGYEPTILLLQLMSPLVLIIGISNCLGCLYYTPAGKRTQSSRYIIVGAFSNLCMNLVLIPHMGAIGAVFGTIVAESIISFLYLKNCKGYLTLSRIIMCSYKKVFAALFMWAIIRCLDNFSNGKDFIVLVLEILIGVVVYAGILLLFKDFTASYLWSLVLKKANKIIKR